MNKEKIDELMKSLEGPKLEHKSKDFLYKKSKDIAIKISSFINSQGGLILIGVRDKKPDGLELDQKHEERISQICRDRLNPPQSIDIDFYETDNGTIMVLEILPSREPIQTNNKYYIRHGSTTQLMTPEEIKRKFIESEKLYKIINKKEAMNLLKQRQLSREIIIDRNNNKILYLTLESFSKSTVKEKNIIYSKLFNFYDKESKLIFSTLHRVTIEELTKIMAQFYRIFGDFSNGNSSFSIEQSGLNWVGYGPIDFINTIESQKIRYKDLKEKYGKDVYIHHRETAFFIDEINDAGIFFISCEPNYWKKTGKITMDYFDVGFVLKDQPFSRLFNDFFKLIEIEPFTIISNDTESILTKHILNSSKIPFQVDGFIQSIEPWNEDEHNWVSGAYGRLPTELKEMKLNKEIVVSIRNHNLLEDEVKYYIDRIKYTKFELGCFSSVIVDISIDWNNII